MHFELLHIKFPFASPVQEICTSLRRIELQVVELQVVVLIQTRFQLEILLFIN